MKSNFEIESHKSMDCFGSPFFNACIEALQLHEEMDKYNEWRDTLGKKK